jgi:putative endonuclease
MHYVYVLKGHMRHPLYIGVTHDLRKRVEQHNRGLSEYSRKSDAWKLVYYEAYASRDDAKTREKALKKFGSAYGHLKQRIQKSIST